MCTAHPVMYTQAQTPPTGDNSYTQGPNTLRRKSGGRQLRTTGRHEASQHSIVCVATTSTIQYTTETIQKMVGAHSRSPNPTGDYNHQQQKQYVTITCPSTSLHPSGRTHEKCSQTYYTSLPEQQARCPNSYSLPHSKPATELEGTTPRLLTSEYW
ncbi:hypothetical protein E2C01_081701 [Portunus trituberculatus]|uniref:Uncharacterized protein n=1 Tax=Portunus trituberculatus TaxID=210409 RepID=A0A5B7J310_PORTR|nr:hypothetical protein [Portunus trituberculatus]